ncbi:hypothetical protein GOP47_0009699 [Adiantum capillus-veneris]|uniref:Uncharacterized protein n=1 Tax=Adiantum capillus-veneris TaxID=13818 RepID=A0A9D4ZHE2_ADICA|nr:hypothetical protein GOP47_0009699 [Adiantum capillus-veneris]
MGSLLVDRCLCNIQSRVARAKVDVKSLEMKQGTLDPTSIKFMIWDSERGICKTPDYPYVYAKCDIVQIICGSQDLEGRRRYDVYAGSDIKSESWTSEQDARLEVLRDCQSARARTGEGLRRATDQSVRPEGVTSVDARMGCNRGAVRQRYTGGGREEVLKGRHGHVEEAAICGEGAARYAGEKEGD